MSMWIRFLDGYLTPSFWVVPSLFLPLTVLCNNSTSIKVNKSVALRDLQSGSLSCYIPLDPFPLLYLRGLCGIHGSGTRACVCL